MFVNKNTKKDLKITSFAADFNSDQVIYGDTKGNIIVRKIFSNEILYKTKSNYSRKN